MTTWLPAAFLTLSLIILIWDVVLAGRIAQLNQASRPFATITGLAGLLVLPAVLIRIATATFITGRAVVAVDWIWPLIVVLFAVQAAYAVWRKLVNYLWGIPVLVYDVLIAAIEVVRLGVGHGSPLGNGFAGLLTAQTSTLAQIMAPPTAVPPLFFSMVPILAPAFPALRRTTAAFRAFVMVTAVAWVVLTAVIGTEHALQSGQALREHATDQIHERPTGDFRVGLKIFPDIATIPSAAAVSNDLALVDSLGVRAVAVVERIHPDILIPAEAPMAVGSRIVGRLSAARWEAYFSAAARKAKALDTNVHIGLSISSYGSTDSVLYAWAARHDSPIDILGFSLFPDETGLRDITKSS